tara:strand:+ start:198 stop:1292 length:1095 start_codon:yes stop_codon:yes gene_type:complete
LAEGDPPRPEVRVHVNLWRDLDSQFNFLDIGLQLGNIDDVARLYLYFPVEIRAGAVVDLSGVMKDESTLKAVFNDVAEVLREEDDFFVISLADGIENLAIHHIDVSKDISLEPVNVPGRSAGTTLTFKSSLCSRLQGPIGAQPYLRLRIHLGGPARNLFTTEDRAPGLGLALARGVVETTEFRLNERRSFPPDIFRRANSGRIILKSVHYFLIRSKRFQLGSQHQNFRKLRHLEGDIWKGYLAVGRTPASRASERRASEMIIYQWRAMAKDGGALDDFIAHASFSALRHQVPLYLMAALAIGGLGSAVLNITLALVDIGTTAIRGSSLPILYANILALAALGVMIGTVIGVAALVGWIRRRSIK